MKSLLTIFTLVFTMMFSSTIFGEWKMMGNDEDTKFYIDVERIRKHDGYVYFWSLTDYSKPFTKSKLLSSKNYYKVDCDLFRYKILQYVYHKESMGRDIGETDEPHNKGWRYPQPNLFDEFFVKFVCKVN